MAAALEEPDVELRTANWNKLLAGMRLGDVKSVRAIFLENDKRGRWFVPEWIAFWRKYGELSTVGALDEWQASGDPRDVDSPVQLVAAAIKARGLPEARLLLDRNDVRESAVMIEALFHTVARVHPKESIPFMMQSVPEVLRPQAAKAIAEIGIAQGGLEQAVPLMRSLEAAGTGADPQQAAFSAMLTAAWRGGPERVQEFALSHVQQPWCTGTALGSVSAQLAGENPAAAMDFITRLPENLDREKLETCMDMAVDQSLRLNPDDIGRWLLDHPKARHYDHITASYCQALSVVDPVAAESWARTVQDPGLRSKALSLKDG